MARRIVKILHELGAIGLTGALVCHMVLLAVAPMDSLAEYAAIRRNIEAITGWALVPSLLLVLTSGLATMIVHHPFQNLTRVWAKALMGFPMFEGTLMAIDGMAQTAAMKRGFFRYRLFPQIMVFVHFHISWLLYSIKPKWSYSMNAEFEDHAERSYMKFIAENPELDQMPYDAGYCAEYGEFAMVDDGSPSTSASTRRRASSVSTLRASASNRVGGDGPCGPRSPTPTTRRTEQRQQPRSALRVTDGHPGIHASS